MRAQSSWAPLSTGVRGNANHLLTTLTAPDGGSRADGSGGSVGLLLGVDPLQRASVEVVDARALPRARVADDDKQVPTGRHFGAVLVTQRDAIPEDVQLLVRGQDEVWVLQLVVDELRELEALGALERTQRSRSRAC